MYQNLNASMTGIDESRGRSKANTLILKPHTKDGKQLI